MTKPPGPLVHVTWCDSCSAERKWHDHAIRDDFKPETCYSVGWLLRKDTNSVVICGDYSTHQFGNVTAIPAQCVVKIRRLK